MIRLVTSTGDTLLVTMGLVVTILMAGGCGPETKLVRVWGTVTFAGQDVAEGTIEFSPIEGTPGSSAGGIIREGRYEVPKLHGLLVGGTYKVTIISMRKTTRPVQDFSGPKGERLFEFENFIPSQYNTATELKIKVPREEERRQLDFYLQKPSTQPA